MAHVVSHPIQYFAPLYRELAARDEVELIVYFCSDVTLGEFHDEEFGREIRWDADLVSGFTWRVVPSGRGRSLRAVRRQPQLDLFRELVAARYDVIWIHGYAYPNAWLAAFASMVSGAALLIREEQTLLHRRVFWRRVLKGILIRALFRRASGLYIGEENRRYFAHYGLAPESLFAAPYAVDNSALRRALATMSGCRDEIRRQWGITDDAPVVLFSGKLVNKKDPLLLLRAYARIREDCPCWLVIAGDGPLGPAIDSEVVRREIPGVLRLGFVNQSELPTVYAAGDVLVLPSAYGETWGLVVNEALNFSLPVIVSDKVGCAADLVRDGQSGFVVPAGDVNVLASRLGLLVRDAELRRRFGARGRAIVDEYSIGRTADGIVRACLAVTGRAA